MQLNVFTGFFLFINIQCVVFSQPSSNNTKPTGDPKIAAEEMKLGNFHAALNEYLLILKKDSTNEQANFRVGVCYLNTEIDKTKASFYFEKIQDKSKEPELNYLLAKSYQFAYRFDDAIKTFSKYKLDGKGGSKENKLDADLQIQNCINAKEIMKYPLNVLFENLGKNINSEYPDYYPFAPDDESYLIFNSKRQEANGIRSPDGSWSSTIYFSKVKDGIFTKAKPLGRVINSATGDEEAIGLSCSGDYLLFYYTNWDEGDGDIYISKADKQRNFKEPMILDEQINSFKGQEISASISSDGNTIYFASARASGLGGSDIYVCKRLPTGKWSVAQNLGEGVNTSYNEDFPTISPDGNLLYFSSMGHTGMGGYDIFVSKWDTETQKFSKAKNIGYPINTPENDMNFMPSSSGKFGYISARRKNGFGDMDIYRINFLDLESEYTVVTGKVKSLNSLKPADSTHVFISIMDDATGEEFGTYMPNPNSGKYVFILPPGKFVINTEMPGFKAYKETIQIFDKGSFKPAIEKNILLTPEEDKNTAKSSKSK